MKILVMKSHTVMFGIVIVTVLGFAEFSAAGPTLSWTPDSIQQEIDAGTVVDVPIIIEVTGEAIVGAELRITPSLSAYITSDFGGNLNQGITEILLHVDVPIWAKPELVDGVVQVVDGNSALSRPLPVVLDIGASPTATIDIQVLDTEGRPAGQGVEVLIDGVVRSSTNAEGKSSLVSSAGVQKVGARVPDWSAGVIQVDAAVDQVTEVEVALASGEALALLKDYSLIIHEATDAMLPPDLTSMRLRFVDPNGIAIPITFVDAVLAESISPEPGTDATLFANLSEYFELTPDGFIQSTDVSATLAGLGTVQLPLSIKAFAGDDEGFLYWGEAKVESLSGN